MQTSTQKRGWPSRALALAFTLVALACAIVCASPGTALADSGSGSSGIWGSAVVESDDKGVWADWWDAYAGTDANGDLQPQGGWGSDSTAAWKARFQAAMGAKGYGVAWWWEMDSGDTCTTLFEKACSQAIEAAIQQSNVSDASWSHIAINRARIVGVVVQWAHPINNNESDNVTMLFDKELNARDMYAVLENTSQAGLDDKMGWDQDSVPYAGYEGMSAKEWVKASGWAKMGLADDQKAVRVQAVAVVTNQPESYYEVTVNKVAEDQVNLRYSQYKDLSGATFKVYRDEACTQEVEGVGTITTNSDGTTTFKLRRGTYYLREISAPKNYKIKTNPYKFEVGRDKENKVEVTDEPITHKVDVSKAIEQLNTTVTASGDASVEGAIFELRYYGVSTGTSEGDLKRYGADNCDALKRWYLRSDAAGKVSYDAAHLVNDETYKSDALDVICGHAALLAGSCYSIREVAAPAGLMLEGQTDGSDTSYKAPEHFFTSADVSASVIEKVDEEHPFKIQKTDFDTATAKVSRGDNVTTDPTTLEGNSTAKSITFELYNTSGADIVYNGKLIASGTGVSEQNKVGAKVVTSDDGSVTFECLPYGTYTIHEVVSEKLGDEWVTTTKVIASQEHHWLNDGTASN